MPGAGLLCLSVLGERVRGVGDGEGAVQPAIKEAGVGAAGDLLADVRRHGAPALLTNITATPAGSAT
ncbi:hypothetical protein [Streptomyces sp. NPDC002187]|uniref:hypothetical protein n=1 Tax=Streptomyces sp. NPDC002187 TaxID=3364637 RepID=UPI0036AD28DE